MDFWYDVGFDEFRNNKTALVPGLAACMESFVGEYRDDGDDLLHFPFDFLVIRKSRLLRASIGRIIDLGLIRKEIENIEPSLKTLGRIMKYHQPETPYLQNRHSSLQRRMAYLRNEEGHQMKYRAKYARLVRGPRLPREIIGRILTFVPSSNMLQQSPTFLSARVDGLLHHAILNPSVLIPHYKDRYRRGWTLTVIARQIIKLTLLDDALLTGSIQLRIVAKSGQLKDLARDFRLHDIPQRWKTLTLYSPISMDEFTNLFSPWPPCLEELTIDQCSPLFSTTNVIPLECSSLKSIWIRLCSFHNFFNSVIRLASLTELAIGCYSFSPDDVSIDAVNDLTRTLAQLVCLESLSMKDMKYGLEDDALDHLEKVKSTSLRYLTLVGPGVPFLFRLFSECPITYLEVSTEHLDQSEQFFSSVKRLYIRDSAIPELLRKPMKNGKLAFPGLEQLMVKKWANNCYDDAALGYELSELIRVRAADEKVSAIKCLSIPREFVRSKRLQEELVQLLNSVVLTD